jgi:hypothetical protein
MKRFTLGGGKGLTLCLVAVGLAVLTGCSTYKGLQPIYPEYGDTVDSLQPTLQWKPLADPSATYDLVIYKPAQKGFGGSDVDVEQVRVYYRQRLKGSSHRIEKPLEPNTHYTWSVRARLGEDVTSWSKHETTIFLGISRHRRVRILSFTTPAG